MDLNRAPNDVKLNLCRWYFRGGFCFLPLLWLVNTVWFYGEAFTKPAYEEQKQIRQYVIVSSMGVLVWVLILGAWVMTFQLQRSTWGSTADALSFIIPAGRA